MIRFTSTGRLLFVCIMAGLLLPLVAAAQEPPCYELPECYPPSSGSPSIDFSPPEVIWGGYSDGRLNPEMAEYYSIWCLDNVIRVLRGVPTTALIDDIPIAEVSSLPANSALTRTSGLSVMRNNDGMIAVSGNNGNTPQEGLKVFSLAECLERNDYSMVQLELTTDNESQPGSINLAQRGDNPLAEFQGDDAPFDDHLENDPYARLAAWILEYVRAACSVPLSFLLVFPAGWRIWSRRNRGKKGDQS